MIYGYARVSTPKQNIDRQVRNILQIYPNAKIYKEIYTGTKFYGRTEWEKIMRLAHAEDIIVFDSVSRMARNAADGYALYEQLYNNGIDLVYINEPHINTATYKQAIANQIDLQIASGDTATDELMQTIVDALNKYILALAKKQIYLAFEQAQKEVDDLRQRTREGIETARLNGKQIGQHAGATLITKKSKIATEKILKYSKDFGGTLNDIDCMQLIGISRNTYYKYKKALK